jgi:hypothetical protein
VKIPDWQRLLAVASEEWKRSINAATRTHHIPLTVQLLPQDKLAIQSLEEIKQPDFFRPVLKTFIRQELTGREGLMYTEYHRRSQAAGSRYFPKWTESSTGKTPQEKGEVVGKGTKRTQAVRNQKEGAPQRRSGSVPDMRRGFDALWESIAEVRDISSGDEIRFGIGPMDEVRRHRLNEYMQTRFGGFSKNPQLNELFRAVEFGTGVEGNVGSSSFVRDFGPNAQSKYRGPKAEYRGAWWLGKDDFLGQKVGVLWTGQEGFHFLYDQRTRRMKSEYRDRIIERLPAYLRRAVTEKLSGNVLVSFQG